MRSRPDHSTRLRRWHVLLCAVALLGTAPLSAQFQLPRLPFPFPAPPGGAGLPTLPFLTPPLPAVPENSPNHRDILNEYGGAITGPHRAPVLKAMDAISAITRPVSPPGGFRVTLLDSSEVNAFALSEGNTYVTRQILGLMNSEEELIGVMGHEVGHAIARHGLFTAAGRNSQNAGGSMLSIVSPSLAAGATFAGTFGLRVFERAQEHQADVTGVKVLADLGLDPLGMYRAIELLHADQQLKAELYGEPAPGQWDYWLRTHPADTERLGLIAMTARMAPRAAPRIVTNRAAFIRSLDGLMFDDGPREGILDGRSFRRPSIRLAMDAPAGFTLRNGSGSLLATAPGGARALVRHRAEKGDLAAAFRAMWLRERGKDSVVPAPILQKLNGLDLALGGGQLKGATGTATFVIGIVAWPAGGFVELMTIDPGGAAQEALQTFVTSLRYVSVAEAAAVKVRRIRVVTVGARDSVASLAGAMAYGDHQEARFRALNGLNATAALPRGVPVKLVVWSD